MPCSPVIAPPQATIWEKSSSSAALGAGANLRILVITDHYVHVDVPVSGMSETGNRKSAAGLEPLGEFDEIDEFAARNNDILVQLS